MPQINDNEFTIRPHVTVSAIVGDRISAKKLDVDRLPTTSRASVVVDDDAAEVLRLDAAGAYALRLDGARAGLLAWPADILDHPSLKWFDRGPHAVSIVIGPNGRQVRQGPTRTVSSRRHMLAAMAQEERLRNIVSARLAGSPTANALEVLAELSLQPFEQCGSEVEA